MPLFCIAIEKGLGWVGGAGVFGGEASIKLSEEHKH